MKKQTVFEVQRFLCFSHTTGSVMGLGFGSCGGEIQISDHKLGKINMKQKTQATPLKNGGFEKLQLGALL